MSYKEIFKEKIEKLAKTRGTPQWSFIRQKDLDLSGLDSVEQWEPLEPDFQIEDNEEYWFRHELTVPEEIQGISTEGTPAYVHFWFLAHTEVFIDRHKIFEERFWADAHKPEVLITDEATPGQTIEILIHVRNRDLMNTCGAWLGLSIGYGSVDEVIFEMETFLQEMDFCSRFEEVQTEYKQAEDLLEREVKQETPPVQVIEILRKAREILDPVKKITKRYRVHLIAHAHIDMNWLWDMQDTIDVCRRDFSTMLQLMKETPAFRFSQSQASVYEITRVHHPEIFRGIQDAVKENKWDATAATWTEGDLNMASGEAQIRHLLYTKFFMDSQTGTTSRVCWEPDTFGHPANTPQILRNAGVNYYFHMRTRHGLPEYFHEDNPLYWWEGVDGTRIMAYNIIYSGFISAAPICRIASQMDRRFGMKHSMYIYGVGDHGGGPSRRDIQRAQWLDSLPTMPRLEFSTTHRFFDEAAAEAPQDLPVWRGEMNPIFDGCYTSHADIKRGNRIAEHRLMDAEAALAAATAFGNLSNDSELATLEEHWRSVLFNQFHDIFDGCAIHKTYEVACRQLDSAARIAGEMAAVHLSKLAAAEEAGEGKAFAVWNLLGFRRDDVVELDLPEGWQGCRVYNDDGLEVPSQVFEGKVLFIAESVPAFGYLVFRLKQAEPAESTGAQTEESGPLLELNRGRYAVRMERHSGCIIYLKDQKTGRIYLKPLNWFYQKTKENNVFSIAHETPHYMSAWNIGSIARIDRLVRDAKVTLKAEGPVAEIVEIEHRFRESAIRQYVRFYRDLPRMDFFTRVQWNETSGSETDAPMLQVSFCPDLEQTGRFTCEIPFGAIERPADGTEYPAQRWVDISGSGSGFTLVNDCKYGFHADGNRLTMTCIRTSYAPDPEPDKGEHRFNYALIPHEQSWQEAGSAEHGAAFNSPLHALEIENFGSPARMEPGADLLTLEGTGVKITSLKPSHDGRGYVLRLCEYFGRESLFKLAFCRKPAKVIEESVTEDKAGRQLPMSDNTIEDTLPPHGILTLKIIPETPGAK